MGKPVGINSIFDGMKGKKLNKLMTACFVIPSWRSIVGDKIALHCKPVSFEYGLLLIECDSSTWCSQISDYRSMILSRINDVVGTDIVSGLNPVVAKKTTIKISNNEKTQTFKIEQINPKQFAWAESVAETVPTDVRESFLKAMLTIMTNKKRREK